MDQRAGVWHVEEGGGSSSSGPAVPEDVEEGEPVKKLVAPTAPTASEREEHAASGHAVFRTWCRECCIGRGRMHQHRAGGKETTIPAIAIDYGYLNERGDLLQEAAGAPILVRKCNRDRWIGAAIVPTQGADEHAVAELKNDVIGSGFTEVLVRSDNEPAILALKESAATALKLAGVNVKTEESALYGSQSNGLAESAVKDAKDAVRTNLACLVRRFGLEFPGGHPVLTWLVKYSVAMVNRCRRGPDGKTAYELRKGRKFARALPHFAEKILFMVPGVTKGVARVSNQDGRTESSLVCLTGATSFDVGAERGMHKVRTVRRREATERVDLTFLNSVSARPWDGPKKVRDVRIVLPDVSSPAAMAEAEAIGKGRRLYISKADIMKHGLTEGCLGCRCLAEGKRAQGHSEGCRTRLEAEIAKTEDGRARLTTAYLRSLPRDEGREPDAGAGAPAAVPAPPRPDGVQDEPMDAREASRKRRAEDAGHEADDAGRGGAQPDPGSMVDNSMPELRPRRSEPMMWHLRRRSRRRAGSELAHSD